MPSPPAFPWRQADTEPKVGRRAVVPRMASAAVRIPDPRTLKSPLQFASGPQIFVHEGARQALERKLELAAGCPVHLAVTDNRQRMITQTRERSLLRVRVHMMFLDAPERVQDGLVEFVLGESRRASRIVGDYIEKNGHRIRASRPVRGPLLMRGRVHDLAAILHRVNETYFGGAPSDVLIKWGRRTRAAGRARSTIKLGSYSAEERLIRVHPVLDRTWVPRYFVSYIVHHELVHHVVPPVRVSGRALVHSPEFLKREREFRHYERAIAWEEAHIGRLLRSAG